MFDLKNPDGRAPSGFFKFFGASREAVKASPCLLKYIEPMSKIPVIARDLFTWVDIANSYRVIPVGKLCRLVCVVGESGIVGTEHILLQLWVIMAIVMNLFLN